MTISCGLAPAPYPWQAFANVMAVGTVYRYEVVFVLRSRHLCCEAGSQCTPSSASRRIE